MTTLMISKIKHTTQKRKTSQKGITMVELLVYMGLLAILLVTLTELFVSIVDVKLGSEAVSAVEQDGKYIMARLAYDLNRADSITTPATPGASSNSLVIVIGGDTNTYALSGDNFQLTNTNGTDSLNSSETIISNTNFTRVGSSTIKISLTVTSVVVKEPAAEQKTFSTTAGIRQ